MQRFVDGTRGVVAFHLHRTLDARAGFSSRHEDLLLNGVADDGVTVKVHIVSYTIDGKAAAADAQAALQQAYEHPSPTEAFNPPFDSRYTAAYRYQSPAQQKIAFTSDVKDAAHGNGNFEYDSAGNVVVYTYQPNVLPPHATFGAITDRRSEVLSGYWAVTQEIQQYKGSYGPFSGTGTVQADYSEFRRFPDVESAESTI